MKLEIIKVGINGEGIAYYHSKPVFIPGAFPDEIVECDIYDEGKYYRGRLKYIIKKNKSRIKSKCRHSGKCDACPLMEIEYVKQLEYKKQLLQEALYKYARFDEPIDNTNGSDKIYGYRNKCNLPLVDYRGRIECALYAQNSNIPIIIDNCLVHDEILEDIRKKIIACLQKYECHSYDKKTKKGFRQLVLRGFAEEYQLCLITGDDSLNKEMIGDISEIEKLVSIYQCINISNKGHDLMDGKFIHLFGSEKINLKLDEYSLKLSPKAFFQLNYDQALNIYRKVRERIGNDNGLVVEAYCGIGGISLFVADKAKKIIGIELNSKAIEDAKENASINSIDNAEFICGDAGRVIKNISKKKTIDTLIVDPPRSGLSEEMLECIRKSKIRKIIYISCNPATLAKNLNVLREYKIDSLESYDMFPNTPLIESIITLSYINK